MTLRELRQAAGLRLVDIAALLGCSVAQVSRVEVGERHLQGWQRDILAWRFGWTVEDVYPAVERRVQTAVRPKQSLREVQLPDEAEMVGMIGLVWLKTAGEAIPDNWRDRWHNRSLWATALRLGMGVWRSTERDARRAAV